MSAPLSFRFDVDGENFTSAGEASVQVKKNLRSLGVDPETIRKVSIAMYEGEINMVIHAGGGVAEVFVEPDVITIVLTDHGPASPTSLSPCRKAFPPRRTTSAR